MHNSAENSKESLRIEARKHRSRLSSDGAESSQACDLFFEYFQPSNEIVLAGYWPVNREFDVLPILERALESGIRCALPVLSDNERIMRFALWTPEMHMVPGPYNIPEPRDKSAAVFVVPDMVLVPLLAFDRRGYRLGQGGGYYDATLSHLRKVHKVLAIGAAYAEQACLFNLPNESFDEKLDFVVTPQTVNNFQG